MQSLEQAQKYIEVGKANPSTIIVDDSEILNEGSKIAKLIIYSKQFIWGVQVFYSDGNTTGIHAGLMESEIPPQCEELTLEPNEDIQQIAGYVDEYIGALHIKTTLGKILDIGKLPLGDLFVLEKPNGIITRLVTGYTGYLSYLGVFVKELMPVQQFHSVSTFLPKANYFVHENTTLYQPLSLLQSASLLLRPTTASDIVEYTEMIGNDYSCAGKFNDYEELVAPILRAGNKIRISRIKLYKDKAGIIGIKTVYTSIDKCGKVTKHERPHRSKAVGFFTSRASINFSAGEYVREVVGSFGSCITHLKMTSTSGKIIESGREQGKWFSLESKDNRKIIAFAGSCGDYLYTLRAYCMNE